MRKPLREDFVLEENYQRTLADYYAQRVWFFAKVACFFGVLSIVCKLIDIYNR